MINLINYEYVFLIFKSWRWKLARSSLRFELCFQMTVLFEFTGQSEYNYTFVCATSSIIFAYVCVRGSVWLTCRVHYVRTCVRLCTVSAMGTLCSHYKKVDYIVLFVQSIHVWTVSSDRLIRRMNICLNNMVSMIDVCYQYLITDTRSLPFFGGRWYLLLLGLLVACTIDMGCWE